MHKIIERTKRFIRNEDGIATAWSIGWLILCFSIAGLSIDVTNAWKVKQFLQSTADVSAHAGGLKLGTVGNSGIQEAVAIEANKIAAINMRESRYGDVLVNNDIQVGFWNGDTKVFGEMTAGTTEIPNAVRVVTRQDGIASSSVGTFFLRFVGFDAFTVAAAATVEKFVSQCEKDGILAAGTVKMSTQQAFLGEYCVHGELGIDVSNANYFELGTIASMKNLENCGPSAVHCENESNAGIEEALRQGSMTLGKLARIDTYISQLQNPGVDLGVDVFPETFDRATSIVHTNLNPKTFNFADDLVPNGVYVFNCSRGENVKISASLVNNNGVGNDTGEENISPRLTKSNVVIVGDDCDFVFDQTISFEDSVFATGSTSNQSISGSANAVLGRNDGCKEGGEVGVITKGDINFAAKLEAYDVEMIAAGSVNLASHGNDGDSIHVGTNIISGGDVDITTKHTFVGCAGATDSTLDTKYTLRYVE